MPGLNERYKMKTIKGNWLEKSDEVKAAEQGVFVFINSNVSKWGGESPDDVSALLAVLEQYPLDATFENYGNFITHNPCVGVSNPRFDYHNGRKEPQWIDGPRIFGVDGVAYFNGNFLTLSHVFSIYTNDAATIGTLTSAIRANQQRPDYLAQKRAAA